MPWVFNNLARKQIDWGGRCESERSLVGSPPRPTWSQRQYEDGKANCIDALGQVNVDVHLRLAFHWSPFGMPRGHGTLIPLTTYYAPLLRDLPPT